MAGELCSNWKGLFYAGVYRYRQDSRSLCHVYIHGTCPLAGTNEATNLSQVHVLKWRFDKCEVFSQCDDTRETHRL